MSKRDITGKEYYKEIAFSPIKHNLAHYCFIAVRTTLTSLDFFVELFKMTNYLFELSDSPLDIVIDSKNFIFQAFHCKDFQSEQLGICFLNGDIHKNHYLLGEKDEKACFSLAKMKNRNQLSFSFEDLEKSEDTQNQDFDEEQNWTSFKELMQKKSTDLLGEADFLFPVSIQTYEILKPLFLEFPTMNFIHYRLISHAEITQVEALLMQWNHYYEKLFGKE